MRKKILNRLENLDTEIIFIKNRICDIEDCLINDGLALNCGSCGHLNHVNKLSGHYAICPVCREQDESEEEKANSEIEKRNEDRQLRKMFKGLN